MRSPHLCAALSIIILTSTLASQVATSRLEGTVQDSSGAMIGGAQLSLVNNKTQVRAETAASPQGYFVFPSLQPGTYTMTAEAPGFRKATVSNIELNVGDTISEVVKLEVGQVTETITVEASTIRIQTTEASITRAVTMRDIDMLPQLGRGPIVLASLQPGVQINPADNSFSRINGMRQGSNNNTLDGVDVNDSVLPRLGL